MVRRNSDILEICLERLAQGDTIDNCLADYPQQADVLRPLLQASQQVQSLRGQQPSAAADNYIEQRLRRAARRREQGMAGRRPFSWEVVMKSVMRLVPRVVVGMVAVGIIVFVLVQLPFWHEPEIEPMVAATAIAVLEGGSGPSLEADLSADPGQVPLYQILPRPAPDTPEAMLAWARTFGLLDPVLYEQVASSDPAQHVIGSDGRRLIFNGGAATGEIFYSNPAAAPSGEALTWTEASQIAVDFLDEHDLLPAQYQVDAALFEPSANGWQNVVVRAAVDEGVIGELNGYGSSQSIMVASDGQVVHASLRPLEVQVAATTVEVISAQEAYANLLAGESIGSSRGEIGGSSKASLSYTRPIDWQVGQAIDVVGYLELLVGVADGDIKATLSYANGVTFQLMGPRLTELAAETWSQSYRLQGTVMAQLGPSSWEVEVQDWQPVAYDAVPCLSGELVRQENGVQLRSDEGKVYELPQAPEEIVAGERLQVCLRLPGEPEASLDWSVIQVLSPSEQVFSSGGGVTVEEVAVTRVVVSDVVELEGDTAAAPVIPLPPDGVAAATEAPAIVPESPYTLGDSVEIIGYVQGVRLINDAGSSRLELQLIHDEGQEKGVYFLPYPLLAPAALMEEMAALADLHIRVRGEIVAAPEDTMYISSHKQAIAVESFDRPWPEEKLENFLGHFSVEEIEGQQRMVFTDHGTGKRYVVDPQFPVVVSEHDPRMSEEQGLLTAIVHPAAEPIGGLPVLLNRGYATGPEISLATDVSQFPLPTESRIGTINESFLRGNEIGEGDIIERVELVYPYQPPFVAPDEEAPEAEVPLVEPVWVFYGRNAQSTLFFVLEVRAVR